METVIKIKNVTKRFKEVEVLKNISAEFEKGKIHGIVGRNGSGKSVLFKAICGFINIDSGEIWIRDEKLWRDIDVPSDVGIIIDSSGFLPYYSGLKNLKFLASLNRKIDIKKIREIMLKVGLDPDSKKHVSKYSLGMRQRLSIAQAIMEDQDIIILDEPMNGLDKNGVDDIRNILLELKKEGKTLLLASHNTEDIKILCDKVYEMESGILTVIES
ncbi:ATP-binding cassette domain-containing protein [Anaerotignum sp.]